MVAVRAVLKLKDVMRVKMHESSGQDLEDEIDRTAAERLREIFNSFSSDPASSTLEQKAFQYTEVDGAEFDGVSECSAGHSVIKSKGHQRRRILTSFLLGRLQICPVAVRAGPTPSPASQSEVTCHPYQVMPFSGRA